MEEPWWVRYYRERFLEEYEPFDEADTLAPVRFVERALGPSPSARRLDLACGWGRHSRPLVGAATMWWGSIGVKFPAPSSAGCWQEQDWKLRFQSMGATIPRRSCPRTATRRSS